METGTSLEACKTLSRDGVILGDCCFTRRIQEGLFLLGGGPRQVSETPGLTGNPRVRTYRRVCGDRDREIRRNNRSTTLNGGDLGTETSSRRSTTKDTDELRNRGETIRRRGKYRGSKEERLLLEAWNDDIQIKCEPWNSAARKCMDMCMRPRRSREKKTPFLGRDTGYFRSRSFDPRN